MAGGGAVIIGSIGWFVSCSCIELHSVQIGLRGSVEREGYFYGKWKYL